MKIDIVIDFLERNGLVKTTFSRGNKKDGQREIILEFNDVYINKDKTEIYIVEEKEFPFTKDEVQNFEDNILTFIQFLSNHDPIKYNINLVLLCPLKDATEDEKNYLFGLERSKFTCRKIILDTSKEKFQEEELAILPSFPVEVEQISSEPLRNYLINMTKEVVHQELYNELIKDKRSLELETVLGLLDVQEEKKDE